MNKNDYVDLLKSDLTTCNDDCVLEMFECILNVISDVTFDFNFNHEMTASEIYKLLKKKAEEKHIQVFNFKMIKQFIFECLNITESDLISNKVKKIEFNSFF